MAQTTAKPSFGPALAVVGLRVPSLACVGGRRLCWPSLAVVVETWVVWWVVDH